MYRQTSLGVIAVVIALALALALIALAVRAELVIRLNNGLEYRLPIAESELRSATFSESGRRLVPASSAAADAPQPAASAAELLRPRADPAVADTAGDDAGSGLAAGVIRVGPERALKTPSEAARVAGDGAVIEIDAAVYRGDAAIWRQNDLTIRGVGGRPRLESAGVVAGDKAIWVIDGNRTVIDNIEFSGAQVADKNGAGIRLQGAGLTVRRSYFHDNEIGILCGVNLASELVVEDSEFAANRVRSRGDYPPGHNIYVGKIKRFVLRNSYLHDASEGHNLKSRALENFILYNRISDGESHSSYLVDLPDGGVAYLIGNVLRQGPGAENHTLVSFAAENKNVSDGQALYLVNNTLINDRASGVFLSNYSTFPAVLLNNLLVGPGRVVRGPSTARQNLSTDNPGFHDRAGGDYRLTADSPALNRGRPPGRSMSGVALQPQAEYRFPNALAARADDGALDLGAFEAATTDQAAPVPAAAQQLGQAPRPVPGRGGGHPLGRIAGASAPGPHVAEIQALGDDAWLNLGRPAPDPDWGSARGRSWTSPMPYAEALSGAFLFGEGIHGWVNEDTGRYMDDLWFYDAAAHRWVNLYPGTSVIEPPQLIINADGFSAFEDGRPVPIASMAHGYQLSAWDPRRGLFASMPNPGGYWQSVLPSVAELFARERAQRNRDAASPWLYDPARGLWLRFRSNPSPVAQFGDTLLYIGSRDELLYRRFGQIWFYSIAANRWRRAEASGPPPPFGIEATAAYDPGRDLVYIGGGRYPDPPPGQTLWVYDVAANAWRDPQAAGEPGGAVYSTATAMLHRDSVADELLLVRFNSRDGQDRRGVFAYSPAQNSWRQVGELPPEWSEQPGNASSSGFYHRRLNAHFFVLAGDSRDNARVLVYRYRRGR